MRIDSHQHFWDLAAVDYFWMPTDHPVSFAQLSTGRPLADYERNLIDGSVVG